MYVLFEKKSQGPNSHLAMPIWLQKEIGEQGQKGAMKPRGESEKETHVGSSRSNDTLIRWHSETFCDGYQLIASSLQFLDSVRQDLVPVKENQQGFIALSLM